jgi:hypothetical protein
MLQRHGLKMFVGIILGFTLWQFFRVLCLHHPSWSVCT